MKRVFLIGYPVDHSVSPEMHNAAFRALGLDWRYELLPTPGEQLRQAVERLRGDDCAGANVTIPYKEHVITHLDGVADRALRLGAVNTIVKRGDRLIGDNTDADGFLRALLNARVELEQARVVILGAGGAARAVAYALAQSGVKGITLINRTDSRAWMLAGHLSREFPGVEISVGDLRQFSRAQLVVNATSVGMSATADASPLLSATSNASPMPPGTCVPCGSVAYDLVYRPRRTRFLEQAEGTGARTIDGLGMLVQQGAASLELWTGAIAPVDIMSQAAERALLAEHSANA